MDADIEQLIRYLVAHLKCAACHHQHSPDDFEVLDEGATVLVLLMTCTHCQAQGLLVAFVQEQGPEPRRVRQAEERGESEPITADDVLDMHRFLEGFEEDCITLLRGSPQPKTQRGGTDGRTGHLAARDT